MFLFQTDFVSANAASFVFAPLRRFVHTGCPCLALMSILPSSSSSSLPLKNYWKFRQCNLEEGERCRESHVNPKKMRELEPALFSNSYSAICTVIISGKREGEGGMQCSFALLRRSRHNCDPNCAHECMELGERSDYLIMMMTLASGFLWVSGSHRG